MNFDEVALACVIALAIGAMALTAGLEQIYDHPVYVNLATKENISW